MAETIVCQSRGQGNNFTTANSFLPFLSANVSSSGTEANRQTPVRTAGTISKLFTRVTANTTASDCTVRIRINGANGNSTITVGAGLTGTFQDDVNSDSVTAGDLVVFNVATPASGTLTVTLISCLFSAASNTVGMMGHSGPNDVSLDTTTAFWGFGSSPNNGVAAEIDAQYRIPFACTMRNLFIRVNLNARTTDVVFRSRKNGANGNLVITVGAGVTGSVEDTSNSDALAANDLYNFSFTTSTGTEIMNIVVCRVECESDNRQACLTATGFSGHVSTDGATQYMAFGGDGQSSATENDLRLPVRAAFTVSKMRFRVSESGTTGSSTVNLRSNGGATSITATVGAGATGTFDDDTHTETFDAADDIVMQTINGGGGNFTIRGITFLAESSRRFLLVRF